MIENETEFLSRHIGLNNSDIKLMLKSFGLRSLDELIKKVIPENIFSPLSENLIEKNLSEKEALDIFKMIGIQVVQSKEFLNQDYRSKNYYSLLIFSRYLLLLNLYWTLILLQFSFFSHFFSNFCGVFFQLLLLKN